MFSYSPNLAQSALPDNTFLADPSIHIISNTDVPAKPSNPLHDEGLILSEDEKRFIFLTNALTACFVAGLSPYQAVKEFRDEFGIDPKPLYFEKWRSCWDEQRLTEASIRSWAASHGADSKWVQRFGLSAFEGVAA